MEEKEEELEEGFGSIDPDPLDSHGNVEDDGIFEEEEEEELNLDELLAELDADEDEEPMTEAKDDEAEEAEEDEAEEEGEEEAEALDLEDMSEDDLKKFIEDVIADMVETGELEAGEGGEEEGEDMEGELEAGMEGGEEDVDIEELLAEILAEEEEEVEEGLFGKGSGGTSYVKNFMKANTSEIEAAKGNFEAGRKLVAKFFNEMKGKMDSGALRSDISVLRTELGMGGLGGAEKGTVSITKEELDEAYSTIETLRSELNEVNLLNAKLLYTNKIFKGKNLTESQKVKVLATFDKAKTVSEVKLIHETLNTSLNTSRKPINESKGSASKAMSTTKTKSIINENDAFARMRELAFYSQKH